MSSTEISQAETLFSAEVFECALAKIPAGIFNAATAGAMHARAEQAAKEGVPLLVGIGDTKYFAVRDGPKFNRSVIGEWGHVKYEESGSKMFQCKVGEG